MKITVICHGAERLINADSAYFFNSDTHGDAETLIERAQVPEESDKVVFINSALVENVIIEDINSDE